MRTRCFTAMGLLAVTLAISGCAETLYSQRPMILGEAYQSAKSNQILNPDVGKNLEPVYGLDGGAAVAVMDKYRKDFEKPAPRTVYSISIGGLGQQR